VDKIIEFILQNMVLTIASLLGTVVALLAGAVTIVSYIQKTGVDGIKKLIKFLLLAIASISVVVVVYQSVQFFMFNRTALKVTPHLTAIRDSYGFVTSFEIDCVVPNGHTMTSYSFVYEDEENEPFTNTFDYEEFVGQCVVNRRNAFSLYGKTWNVYGYVTIDGVDYYTEKQAFSDPADPEIPDWDILNENQYIRERHIAGGNHDTYEFQLYQGSTYRIITKVPDDNSVTCTYDATALSTEGGIKAEGVSVDSTGLISVSDSAHGITSITVEFTNRGTKTIYVVVIDSNNNFTD